MPGKEGQIFIEVVCPNCGSVMKGGWRYEPKGMEKTEWSRMCPACRMPVKVEFSVN